jgi:hypothetical protein
MRFSLDNEIFFAIVVILLVTEKQGTVR